jgi:membrane associated rhomboid family serine protease
VPGSFLVVETSVQTCYRHSDTPAGIVCQRCDRPICPKCMHQASVGFHCPECVKSGKQKVVSGPAAFVSQPIVTQVLIGINVLVFVIGSIVEKRFQIGLGGGGSFHSSFGLIARVWQRGASFYNGPVLGSHAAGVGGGQWYRMITAGFLHYGLFHVAINMYALWILGRAVEHIGGRLRFGIIYGVSLMVGSLAALVLSPTALTAGASGAIFGLMGAIFMVQRAQGIGFLESPLLGVLLLNLVFTFGFGGISIGGHIGGLFGGGLAGWILFDLARKPGIDKRLPFALCGVIAIGCLVAGIVFASGYTPT